jgi:hypothetical protein
MTHPFLSHLSEEESRFVCYAAGPDSRERIEVPITHNVGGPTAPEHLAKLRGLLGTNAAQVEELYSKHDGFQLYVQSPEHMGLFLFPINEWEPATQRFKEELDDWGRSLDEAYDFERYGVAFGEPVFSGNLFFLFEGGVYYSDHDGGDDTPLASSFEGFLERIVNDPPKFLFDLGCYARYSDGRTDRQWIPEQYFSSTRKA